MLRVMVVDDSMILRRNVIKMLHEMGLNVIIEAKDGREAISSYNRHKPDFVTMDIMMPDVDGIEAVKAIRAENHDAKIIMVTSWGQEDIVINAIKAGASGYVLKPVTPEKLEKAIVKVFPQTKAFFDSKKPTLTESSIEIDGFGDDDLKLVED